MGWQLGGLPRASRAHVWPARLHHIYRRWREVLADYGPDKILCAEANVDPLERMADWVRPDQMHQAFNFPYLTTGFSAPALRNVVQSSLRPLTPSAPPARGCSPTTTSSGTPPASATTALAPGTATALAEATHSPTLRWAANVRLRRRCSCWPCPVPCYLYQGEELGLPDHTTLPDDARQDPTFARTVANGLAATAAESRCPGGPAAREPASATARWTPAAPWLPQPADWQSYARDTQAGDPASHLALYSNALKLRRSLKLGTGRCSGPRNIARKTHSRSSTDPPWCCSIPAASRFQLPGGTILARSLPGLGERAQLESSEAIWLKL